MTCISHFCLLFFHISLIFLSERRVVALGASNPLPIAVDINRDDVSLAYGLGGFDVCPGAS